MVLPRSRRRRACCDRDGVTGYAVSEGGRGPPRGGQDRATGELLRRSGRAAESASASGREAHHVARITSPMKAPRPTVRTRLQPAAKYQTRVKKRKAAAAET